MCWALSALTDLWQEITDIAEACLLAAAAIVGANNLTIVAMGKFGGRELTYASDLDLCLSATIFVLHKISSRFFQSRARKVSLHRLMRACVPKGKKGRSSVRLKPSKPTIVIVLSFGKFRRLPAPAQ